MKLNDKVYDVLKWFVIIVLPATGALYAGLNDLWGWPMAAEVAATLDYLGIFLGAVLGFSTVQHKKSK